MSPDLICHERGCSRSAVSQLIGRGKLEAVRVNIDGRSRTGVTLESAAAYYGWTPEMVDRLIAWAGVDPERVEHAYIDAPLVDRGEG